MANEIVVTAAKVSVIDPEKSIIKSYIAGATITKGQAVYCVTATGKAGLATAAAASNLAQFRGIALCGAGAGQAVDVLEQGELAGFTLAGNYDALVYLHDTAGVLSTAVGTVTVPVGRVAPMSDKDLTKVLRVVVSRQSTWA